MTIQPSRLQEESMIDAGRERSVRRQTRTATDRPNTARRLNVDQVQHRQIYLARFFTIDKSTGFYLVSIQRLDSIKG